MVAIRGAGEEDGDVAERSRRGTSSGSAFVDAILGIVAGEVGDVGEVEVVVAQGWVDVGR